MAKGKKTRAKYTSKGERHPVAVSTSNAVRRDRIPAERWLIKQKAWLAGRDPWITVPNGNTNDTRARFVRVRAKAEWGDPRKGYSMGSQKE